MDVVTIIFLAIWVLALLICGIALCKNEVTFYRWWDWGYTRILPKDKFEIIKPYLEVKGEKR